MKLESFALILTFALIDPSVSCAVYLGREFVERVGRELGEVARYRAIEALDDGHVLREAGVRYGAVGGQIYSSEAPPSVVAAETYSRGELETYSMRTLELYHPDNQEIEACGQNRIEMAALNMSKRFSEAQNLKES